MISNSTEHTTVGSRTNCSNRALHEQGSDL